MSSALRDLLHLVKLPSDRRLQAFQEMLDLAREDGADQLATHLERALAHERQLGELEQRWRDDEQPDQPAPEMLEVDNLTDHTLSAIRFVLVAHLRSALPDYERSAAAGRVSKAIFPDGLDAVISLPYAEELSAIEGIVQSLREELAAEVEMLGLRHLVARLAKLAVPYREALERTSDTVMYRAVKKARDRGHEFMLEIVALIVGRYFRADDPVHERKRALLLEPLVAQQQALRDDMRTRHGDDDTPED